LADFDAVLQQTMFSDLGLPVQIPADLSAVNVLLDELLQEQPPEPQFESLAEAELPPPDEDTFGPSDPVAEGSLVEVDEPQSGKPPVLAEPAAAEEEEQSPPASDRLAEEPEVLPPDLLSLAYPPDPGKPYLLFGLAGAEYAVALSNVLEIRDPPAVTPLPHVPEWVRGVSNLRGDILSVVDLRAFLGLSPSDVNPPSRNDSGLQRKRLLVVSSPREELTTGLLVDGTRTICRFADDRITGLTTPVEQAIQPYLVGQTSRSWAAPGRTGSAEAGVSSDSGILRVLDLERLLERICNS